MKKYIRLVVMSFLTLFSTNVWAKETIDASSINLLKEHFKQNQDNMVISGLSIMFATDMLANGARGLALQELTTFLNVALESKNKELQLELQNLPKTLEIVNSIWARSFTLAYKNLLQRLFDVDVLPLPKNTGVINDWIKEKTHGKVPSVLEPEPTNPLQVYLVNTISFKDSWQNPFEKTATTEGVFHSLSGQEQKTQMMHGKLRVLYAQNEKLQSIKLPYQNGGFMVVYLPKEGVDFKDFILNLTENDLNLNYASSSVLVTLPKFKIDKQINIIPLFQALGINEIFNEETHDLSAIAGDDGYVDTIAHRAVVKIDEEGSEAAAATVVRVQLIRARRGRETPSFVADRPFLFFITQGDFVGVYTEAGK